MRVIVLLLILTLLSPLTGRTQDKPTGSAAADTLTEQEIDEIIREIDRLYRSDKSYSKADMTIVTPNWTRTLEMRAWTWEDSHTLIRITAPPKERGVGTLRIENEMWNYLPKTNKVIKIPPSMMMSSWMGSDFTNDDLVHEFTLFEDFDYEPAEVENPDSNLVYVRATPHEGVPIVWDHIIIAVRRTDHIPVWQKYYDEHDELIRVLEYSDIETFDGRTIPSVMTMIPQDEEGNRTTIRYEQIEFDAEFDRDEIFTLRNLRQQI